MNGPEAVVVTTQTLIPNRPTAEADALDAARAARGDAAAFERLYRGHVARIHSLARRMLGPDEADEATQDVFVRAWEKLGTFGGRAAFGTWLYRLAVNALLGRRRAGRRRLDRQAGDDETIAALPGRRERTDLRLDLEAALPRLPDGAREVFILHDVEGYKHQEIAELLGISDGTSKSQLHRARKLLRTYLRG